MNRVQTLEKEAVYVPIRSTVIMGLCEDDSLSFDEIGVIRPLIPFATNQVQIYMESAHNVLLHLLFQSLYDLIVP